MLNVVILLASLVTWGGIWRYVARYFKAKGHGAIVSHGSGIAVGFLGSTVLLLVLIGILKTSGTEQRSQLETKAEVKAVAPSSPATIPAPVAGAELPTTSDKLPEKQAVAQPPGKTLQISAERILTSLPRIEKNASPLADGTPRTNVRLSPLANVELIGNQQDVSRFTIMFGLPSDDKAAVIETSAMAVKVLMNTFPDWRAQGNNPMTWLGDATVQLSKNIKRNKDDPKPVVMERQGRRITYKAFPAIGFFLLTVEPV